MTPIRNLIVFLLFLAPAACCAQHEKLLPQSTLAAFSTTNFERLSAEIPGTSLGKFFASDELKAINKNLSVDTEERPALTTFLQSGLIKKYCQKQLTAALLPVAQKNELFLIVQCSDIDQARLLSGELKQIFAAELATAVSGANVFCANSTAVLRTIAAAKQRLATDQRFSKTVERASAEMSDSEFWIYADPIGMAKFRNQNQAATENSKKLFRLIDRQGFDSINSLGLVGKFASDRPNQLLGFINAPKPYSKGMRLLNLVNSQKVGITSPLGGTASQGQLRIDWNSALKNFAPIFDEVAGDGEEGVFELVLKDLKNASDGPQIDIQTELIGQLTGPAHFGSVQLTNNEETVVAIACKSSDKVLGCVEKFYRGDSNAVKVPNVNFPAWSITPVGEKKSATGYVVAVAHDHLWVASSAAAINAAAAVENEDSPGFARDQECLQYEIDFARLAATRYAQIQSGKLTGLSGQLAEAFKLKLSAANAQTNSWPPVESVTRFFGFGLQLSGQSTDDGFRLIGEIK